MSQREFSEKDFNTDGRSDGLKKFRNALKDLSSSIEKGSIGREDRYNKISSNEAGKMVNEENDEILITD